MIIKTADNIIIELDENIISKSRLFENISNVLQSEFPLDVFIDSKTLQEIIEFSKKDKHVLKKNYNPLEIYFSVEMLDYFDHKTTEEILRICNAANYLEYPYLLELCCKLLATRISQGSLKIKNEILGDSRIDDKDIEKILCDLDWMEDTI